MADFLEGAEIMSEEAIENLFADDGQEEQEQEKPAEKTPEEKKNTLRSMVYLIKTLKLSLKISL